MEENNKSGMTFNISGGTVQIAPNATMQQQNFYGSMAAGQQPGQMSGTDLQSVQASPLALYINKVEVLADYTARYFRGSLMEYVDVENKNDITLDNILDLDLADFFRSRLSREIRFDGDSRSLPIPSFLPPLKIQPVISKRYIDVWYQTGEMLRHAEKVILLGINLAGIDSYFADMLRESQAPEIIVIDKDLDTACRHLCRIFQQSPASCSRFQMAGHEARKYNNRFTVIQADLADAGGLLE